MRGRSDGFDGGGEAYFGVSRIFSKNLGFSAIFYGGQITTYFFIQVLANTVYYNVFIYPLLDVGL